MLERWKQAKAGEGQLVLLSGEAGIGKSRLARGMIDAVSSETHVRVSYQCSPYHADSPLYPMIQQLAFAAAIKPLFLIKALALRSPCGLLQQTVKPTTSGHRLSAEVGATQSYFFSSGLGVAGAASPLAFS